jgi:predicted GIY-YIG superfamily endonuclease
MPVPGAVQHEAKPIVLAYAEEYPSIMEARAREHVLKRWRRAWKLKLVDEQSGMERLG